VSLRPTLADKVEVYELVIVHLLRESREKGETVNQMNTNHNTLILLLVILVAFTIGCVGGLTLLTTIIQ